MSAPNDMPQNLITTNNADDHARMRKLLSTCFSEKSLSAQYPTIEAFADLFIKRIRVLVEAPSNIGKGTVLDIVD